MKVSDLIKKLESLKEKHGDNEIMFTVKDHYGVHGEAMTTDLSCGENTNLPSDWNDVSSNGMGVSTIHFRLLKGHDGKNSKIMFRK